MRWQIWQVKDWMKAFVWLLLLLIILFIAFVLAWGGSQHFAPYTAPSIFLQARRAHYAYFLPALYVHVVASPVVLVLGGLGLWPWLRRRALGWHRRLGQLYIGLILGLAAPSGLIMAFFALGDWQGVLCFVLLALLWWWTTWKAWRLALQGQWETHGWYMWRSMALTSSAFFLRLFSFLGAYYGGWRGASVYVLWAWLSWLLPLAMVELAHGYSFLRKQKAHRA